MKEEEKGSTSSEGEGGPGPEENTRGEREERVQGTGKPGKGPRLGC